jgi:hypothetical protein
LCGVTRLWLRFGHKVKPQSFNLDIPSNLIPIFWIAVILAVVSGGGLGVGITLLLSTVSHRKVALPLVWITIAALVAAISALVVILTHG